MRDGSAIHTLSRCCSCCCYLHLCRQRGFRGTIKAPLWLYYGSVKALLRQPASSCALSLSNPAMCPRPLSYPSPARHTSSTHLSSTDSLTNVLLVALFMSIAMFVLVLLAHCNELERRNARGNGRRVRSSAQPRLTARVRGDGVKPKACATNGLQNITTRQILLHCISDGIL